jgi:hypothetical protein
MHPYAKGSDHIVKRQLVRATIAACDAIWSDDPAVRVLHPEPLIHVVAPRDRADLVQMAALQRNAQFEAWDMLAGSLEPELGGHPRYLDLLGANYYHTNQWEHPDVRIAWDAQPRDERLVPLSALLEELHTRYGRPLLIAETSHFGSGRAQWLAEIAAEAEVACRSGVPLQGICIYPVLDRPDWEDPGHWHHSGLWDLERDRRGVLRRIMNQQYGETLRRSRERLPGAR